MDDFTVGEMSAQNPEPVATLEVEDHSEVLSPLMVSSQKAC